MRQGARRRNLPGPFRGKVFVANLLLFGERNSVNHSAIELPQEHSRETDCQICCG